MSKFVQQFDQRVGDCHDHEVPGIQHPVNNVCSDRFPVQTGVYGSRQHDQHPHGKSGPAEQRTYQRQPARQELLRIPQWYTQGHRVDQALTPVLALLVPVALKDLKNVRCDIALQDIRCMQLPQQVQRLFLAWRIIAEFFQCGFPDFVNRAVAIHLADQHVDFRTETVIHPTGLILQHVAAITPVIVPVQLHMITDTRPDVRNPVPELAVHGLCHITATRPRLAASASQACFVSSPTTVCARRYRSCQHLPYRDATGPAGSPAAPRCDSSWHRHLLRKPA